MKTVSEEMIRKRVERTGDGSHKWSKLKSDKEKMKAFMDDINNNADGDDESLVWGWDDVDMDTDKKAFVKILHIREKEN
jgi:stearoyl-CoA desaturase (delta-9 desaturase)